jgi:hypothetical protein
VVDISLVSLWRSMLIKKFHCQTFDVYQLAHSGRIFQPYNLQPPHKMAEEEKLSPNLQEPLPGAVIKPQSRRPHDPTVTFEEYYYYASRTRQEEQTYEAPKTGWREIVLRKKNPLPSDDNGAALEPTAELPVSGSSSHLEISDEEWVNASRAFRTASWGACE